MVDSGKGTNKIIYIAIVAVMALIAIVGIGSILKRGGNEKGKSTDDLAKEVNARVADQVKGSINLSDNSLYDELPDINKYPCTVEGNADIVLEVFSSGEKAGNGYESWLNDTAEAFNKEKITTKDGKSVAITVRAVSSGLGADYIISNRYLPDLYTPSNELYGDYINAQGGNVDEVADRLVGNTAGILVSKKKGYQTFDDVVKAVMDNQFNIGYTNPQTSATGMNFLMTFLSKADSNNITSQTAADEFSKFQGNVPFVAYTTMQMRDSASNGTLDGMVMEYQTYVNEKDLNTIYNFIPFGVRHNNPLYVTSKALGKEEAVSLFKEFCLSDEVQRNASDKGFNHNDDFDSEISVSGSEISQALQLYKQNKDSGKDIVAVFVADCSGSMYGEAMDQLKTSLSNGTAYINNNNYIGLVSYASSVTIELPIAKFDMNQKAYFQGAINRLSANGSTATYEALAVALKMVKDAKADHPDAKTMIFLLSDGMANGSYSLDTIRGALKKEEVPVYTISYTDAGDQKAMKELSNVNEAASIKADSEDVIYQIKSLFNSQM